MFLVIHSFLSTDCCDGTDEYGKEPGLCQNNCLLVHLLYNYKTKYSLGIFKQCVLNIHINILPTVVCHGSKCSVTGMETFTVPYTVKLLTE